MAARKSKKRGKKAGKKVGKKRTTKKRTTKKRATKKRATKKRAAKKSFSKAAMQRAKTLGATQGYAMQAGLGRMSPEQAAAESGRPVGKRAPKRAVRALAKREAKAARARGAIDAERVRVLERAAQPAKKRRKTAKVAKVSKVAKAAESQRTITASDILGGRRTGLAGLKMWICAGRKRTGCGGGRKHLAGSRVVGHLR